MKNMLGLYLPLIVSFGDFELLKSCRSVCKDWQKRLDDFCPIWQIPTFECQNHRVSSEIYPGGTIECFNCLRMCGGKLEYMYRYCGNQHFLNAEDSTPEPSAENTSNQSNAGETYNWKPMMVCQNCFYTVYNEITDILHRLFKYLLQPDNVLLRALSQDPTNLSITLQTGDKPCKLYYSEYKILTLDIESKEHFCCLMPVLEMMGSRRMCIFNRLVHKTFL